VRIPNEIPIFPLEKCVLMPGCNLPLQLFEPRYLQMFRDLVSTGQKHIGIIQPRDPLENDNIELFEVGTIGKLVEAVELPQQKIMITLQGIQRFKLVKEVDNAPKLYRRASIDLKPFLSDTETSPLDVDRAKLVVLTQKYVRLLNLEMEPKALDSMLDEQLVNVISQILPFTLLEKQTLLESSTVQSRSETLLTLLTMATSNFGVVSTDQEPITN
jgi:Lon protease-like protein